MAVNVLPLDRYLRGVVPWEAPKGWHEQTYEAQAVAARSYTLATLQPGEDFDLYPDARSQMYGGVAAERTETNLAIGATAGQVLVWRDRIVPGYYFSSSGGRTSSVHDAWPRRTRSRTSSRSAIRTTTSRRTTCGRRRSFRPQGGVGPRRPRRSRHPGALQLLGTCPRRAGAHDRTAGACSRARLCGRSSISARWTSTSMRWSSTTRAGRSSARRVHVTGFVRGLGRARLQELTEAGWMTVRHVQRLADWAVRRGTSCDADDRVPARVQRAGRRAGWAGGQAPQCSSRRMARVSMPVCARRYRCRWSG